jgi:ATP-dependent exoDNAse (exonuclease V) alpha subunit
MNPGPFFCFVGDFQQLQPVDKVTTLHDDLMQQVKAGSLEHIELQPHDNARSNDDVLLKFLQHVREHQPTKAYLEEFFEGKYLSMEADVDEATEEAMRIERLTGSKFTFLTVTNAGAAQLNRARLMREYQEVLQRPSSNVVYGDPSTGGGPLIFEAGMRVRLTRNVDKQRSFVNGTLGEVEHVLSEDVFVLRTDSGIRVLVHPVGFDKQVFMPVCYGYAMTIRRAQGSTLLKVGLWFNHSYPPDRGYAYVGASRVRRAGDLYHMYKVRRTDWLPVSANPHEDEQLRRGCESDTTDPEERAMRHEDREEEEAPSVAEVEQQVALEECEEEVLSEAEPAAPADTDHLDDFFAVAGL